MAEEQKRSHRVVFELVSSDPEVWETVVGNIENLRKSLGESATKVEVVAHSGGLKFLYKENPLDNRIRKMIGHGVKFAACQNTMAKKNVTKNQLFDFSDVVDSGVAEVIRKQEAGWSYLRSND